MRVLGEEATLDPTAIEQEVNDSNGLLHNTLVICYSSCNVLRC